MSMFKDDRFTREPEEEDWGFGEPNTRMYTDRGMDLVERMISRLYTLAKNKFDESAAFSMDISTHLYREE